MTEVERECRASIEEAIMWNIVVTKIPLPSSVGLVKCSVPLFTALIAIMGGEAIATMSSFRQAGLCMSGFGMIMLLAVHSFFIDRVDAVNEIHRLAARGRVGEQK